MGSGNMTHPVPDIDEPVVIVPYDGAWPALFDEERRRIAPALGDVITGVEHFGSTAVPGMADRRDFPTVSAR